MACDLARGAVSPMPMAPRAQSLSAWPYQGTIHSPSLGFLNCILKDLGPCLRVLTTLIIW